MAAPPINSPPSLSLTYPSVTNQTVPFAALPHITVTSPTVGPPFPPLPDLPKVFFYELPSFSGPRMKLSFQDTAYGPHRNETERDELFRIAFQDAISPEHRPHEVLDKDGDKNLFYGLQALILLPKQSSGASRWRLTYGLWTTALTGLNNFRLAYPGLDFDFDIYVFAEEEQHWLYLGCGEVYSYTIHR